MVGALLRACFRLTESLRWIRGWLARFAGDCANPHGGGCGYQGIGALDGHWVPLTLAAPALGVLLNLPQGGYGWLVLTLALGTPALSMIGTFGAALTVGLKRGGLLLSLLVLPLYVPTLIFGAEALTRGLAGLDNATPLLMLAGITFGVIAILPFAAAAAIRINLR